jgi:hypothetical protein
VQGLEPFVRLFPAQAMAETRVLTILRHDVLPGDEYALVESFCTDRDCDCRRVMLNVAGRRQQARGFLASISFGFDRDNEFAGPFLDPLNPQSEYAEALLELVTAVLADSAYVARLEAHYHQVKQAVRRPPILGQAAGPRRAAPRGRRSGERPRR